MTGDPALIAATIAAYRRAGVDVPVVFPLTWGAAGQDALESTLQAALAPAAHRTFADTCGRAGTVTIAAGRGTM